MEQASFGQASNISSQCPALNLAMMTCLALTRQKRGLEEVRSRGKTRFLDLTKTNKRRLADLNTDDEMEQPDEMPISSELPVQGLPPRPAGLKRPSPALPDDDQQPDKLAKTTDSNIISDDRFDGYEPGTPLADDFGPGGPFFEELTKDNEVSTPQPPGNIKPSSEQPNNRVVDWSAKRWDLVAHTPRPSHHQQQQHPLRMRVQQHQLSQQRSMVRPSNR